LLRIIQEEEEEFITSSTHRRRRRRRRRRRSLLPAVTACVQACPAGSACPFVWSCFSLISTVIDVNSYKDLVQMLRTTQRTFEPWSPVSLSRRRRLWRCGGGFKKRTRAGMIPERRRSL
jgi:hypothetical protein